MNIKQSIYLFILIVLVLVSLPTRIVNSESENSNRSKVTVRLIEEQDSTIENPKVENISDGKSNSESLPITGNSRELMKYTFIGIFCISISAFLFYNKRVFKY
ncbi:hypothetical protein [Carnobacterium maltaromaticum]|uniref:hypothetical protein n=1 Tax=Carnobacterium maltaromaticum TaxID=2751 RepID=UPI00295EC064|nr:hypothetical protein [Carnobacterium maltaromaticum]